MAGANRLDASESEVLRGYGWNGYFAAVLEGYEGDGDRLGRVTAEYSGAFVIRTVDGDLDARVSGRLRYESGGDADRMPAVGDWVVCSAPVEGDGLGMIHGVLERRTKLSRRAAGAEAGEQVIAANVDLVFVTTALGQDLNLRRIERYLTAVWDGGAVPVVVLTKTDLSEDVAEAREAIEPVAFGADIHAVSALTGEGIEELDAHLQRGTTLALIGSSGVGKSTLVNRWLGGDVQDVAELRVGGKGRHTTTHRQLFVLPGGALVIDTPGMRELGLWAPGQGLEEAFPDVHALAEGCRFRDCAHDTEPGCAVRAAVEAGDLPAERLEAFQKLQKELALLAAKRDEGARREARRRERRQGREFRRTPKRQR